MTGARPASDPVSLQKGALLALRQARTRIEALEHAGSEPLAIIGVACRFPGGATTPDAYWQLLRSGTDAISEVPADRWDINSLYDADPEAPGKMTTRWGGFLPQVDQFDPQFFGISPREAESMDPQQRLVLEVSWEAIERAGIAADKLAGSQSGVFLGAGNCDYSLLAAKSADPLRNAGLHRVTGSATNIIAGRVSYTLGLRGPSMVVDTACSSALVAVHLAAQSLHSGECDLALAGGVSLMLAPELSIMFSKAHMLAPDGRCKTFDAAADGFARGEGCGVIVLRRLSDALAHDDPVLAVVRGSAVNQDGRSSGLTAPNGQAQQAVIRKALANAHVTPAQIGYVETHGTGTALGDPIEVQALATVLGQDRAAHDPVLIGAVKTNIGHLEAASGIAGLIKTVLALQHQEIPPSLHFHHRSPHIPWDELPVTVPTHLMPWRAGGRPRLAGVSSFGFSGTNAHVILGEAPQRPAAAPGASRPVHLLCLSAKDESALRELASSYHGHLAAASSVPLADVAHTAHTGRAHFTHRAALTAGSRAEMRDKLGALATSPAAGNQPSGRRTAGAAHAISAGGPPIAFLFTGQGAQYPGMSRQLYETLPTFRAAMQRCDELLRPHLDRSLLSVLYPTAGEAALLDDTTYTQPALFALEYALAEVWQSWGIAPSAAMGHSVGEYVALCVAGVLSLEDALSLIARRGRLMGELPRDGAMAAVFAPESEVAAAIAPHQELTIAAVNGPENTVISGPTAAVQEVTAALRARGTRVERLPVSHAFHSPLMDPVLDALERAAGVVSFAEPRIDLVSNLTGERMPTGQTLDAQYLRRHARETVRFGDGMASLHELGYGTFVEIGPRPVLLGMGRRCLPDDAGVWLPSLRKNRGDWQSMLDGLGTLYTRGATVDWENFDRGFAGRRVILPTYPFQRQRYWAVQQAGDRAVTAGRITDVPDSPAIAAGAPDPQATESWLYRTEWRPQPVAASGQRSRNLAGHWIILADSGGVGRQLAAVLRKSQATCDLIFADSWRHGQEALFPTPPDCRGLIHLWGLDATPAAETTSASLQQDQARHCGSVLQAVNTLGAARRPIAPRLWIVTRGAQPVRPAGDGVAVAQSPLWGLGKVIALEHPEVWGGLIDLDHEAPASSAADEATWLMEDLCTRIATPALPASGPGDAAGGSPRPHEDQVAWREGRRYVARLTRADNVLAETAPLRADVTYAITGGCGGLGSAVAAWMAQQGARHIALIGRGAAADSPCAQALAQTGLQVLAIPADVAQPGQLARALRQIETTMPPLSGIVHAAGVLDDGLLLHQDWTRFQRVLSPKVEGAWNLHALTRALPLDFFVLFSSTASLLGSPGQASYAAGNAFLDALAHHRRGLGLPALSINWGPWNLGMAATTSAVSRQRWTHMGVELLAPEQGLLTLASLVGGPAAQVAVLRVDWAKFTPAIAGDTRSGLRALLSEQVKAAHREAPSARSPLAPPPRRFDQLLALQPGQRPGFLRDTLRRHASNILGMPPENLPSDRNLPELGMDSLMIMEMADAIKQDFQLALYPRELYDHPTIDSMATYLDGELSTARSARTAQGAAALPGPGPGMPSVPEPPPRRAPGRPAAPARQPVAPPQSPADIVFLLSGPRSGSTLLRVMLAGHPQLFCPPELHLLPFETLAQQRQELGRSYLDEGLQRALMELRGCDAAVAKALLDSWIAEGLSIADVYTRLRHLAAPRLLVDKSPTYAGSMDTLRRAEALFGSARYLFLVRHPYAAIESFTRARMHKLIGVDHDDPFRVAEQVWVQTNQNMRDFLRHVDPGRQRVVRFEDLVRRPAETASDICAFLGIPADPAVLWPYEGERMTDGVHGQSLAIGDPNFLSHDRIEPDLADAWKTITLPHPLGPAARQLATALGYALPGLSSPEPEPERAGILDARLVAGAGIQAGVHAGHQANGLRPGLAAARRADIAAREYSATAHGLRLSVTELGPADGPVIVGLHGILDHAMTWEDVAMPLAARGYRFIAPDQRGHGCSAHAAAGAYHLLNYVADLDALLNDPAGQIVSPEQPIVLVGHSMGAAVAATFVSLRPHRVSALTLIEGLMPGEASADEFTHMLESRLQYLTSTPSHAVLADTATAGQRLRQAMPSLSPERAYRMAGRITRPCADGVCWKWDPALLTRADLSYDTLSITPARYRALLARIIIPVTLVYADAGNPHLAQLRAALPQATTEVLPGGHNLQLDAPGALAEIIARSAAPAGIAPAA
jgi:acyl transferase domain-containing protein/pimeloyl-ACP methyl ester carboxylesterase/acyl carrier protein